jgi:hypothetical protein
VGVYQEPEQGLTRYLKEAFLIHEKKWVVVPLTLHPYVFHLTQDD